jgi:hypothetical protein
MAGGHMAPNKSARSMGSAGPGSNALYDGNHSFIGFRAGWLPALEDAEWRAWGLWERVSWSVRGDLRGL